MTRPPAPICSTGNADLIVNGKRRETPLVADTRRWIGKDVPVVT